ncbi:hypothetical protein [Cellulosilyticum ruminicola]|uniref:hypothetical protein n=1 Tax=Cellulosilyticum ruminicola TaxID=425254 RepID=UPI0006D133AC|nr:hypothetical protein [Cellulosilyticum ruminicola]
MSKKTIIILMLTTFLVTVAVVFGVIFVVFDGNLFEEKPDKQMVLIDKGYFNTKTEKNGSVHIVTTGCKVYYKAKYKTQITKQLAKYKEDINSIIGDYFRTKTLEDVGQDGYFQDTAIYTKDEINAILNENIESKDELPVEYITKVVFFDTVYQ